MKQKPIGILGGLGPKTTAEFYTSFVQMATTNSRPGVAIWSLPLDAQKESEYISSGLHTEYYLSLLKDGIKRLTRTGVNRIVIPCNTVHEFHPQLKEISKVPVTNLIEIVGLEVQERKWEKAFLLATSRTLATRLYQRVLDDKNIQVCLPNDFYQHQLDLLIQGLLGDRDSGENQNFLEEIISQSGTENIILGCTDLQLLFSATDQVIDSMEILARYTAKQYLN